MDLYENILETLGNTPLVKLDRYCKGPATVAAKIESFNPGSSVKDRIGIAMIEAAEEAGQLSPGQAIVEPTSGNTGLGLAIAAILRGHPMICTSADKIPPEKVALLEAYGVEVITCPTNVSADDPKSYYKTAERIRDERGAFLPYQYYNQANPEAHYRSTGPEIWRQTEGKVTHWVAGVGTGGTISGAAKYLKEQNPDIKVIGVDPIGSVYQHYKEHGELPHEDDIHQYLIDGIGEDLLPESVWMDTIDEIIKVDDQSAYDAVFELAQTEAIFTGSSGAAAAVGARRVADELGEDGFVVTLFPDSGERYLSKLNPKWLKEQGLLGDG
ncbi:MAG: PLP-dependent cysteine synthase family protein [Thermoanaerobaculia bacterium]